MNDQLAPVQELRARAALVRAGHWSAADPVPSPCVSVCRLDEARRFCLGCLRSLDEIRQWREADVPQRLAIWARIEKRLPPPPSRHTP